MFLESLAAAVVSVVSNVTYYQRRRTGRGGVGRIVAFWCGVPFTWLTLFLVPVGAPEVEPPPDDEDALLDEIRRVRRAELHGPSGAGGDGAT